MINQLALCIVTKQVIPIIITNNELWVYKHELITTLLYGHYAIFTLHNIVIVAGCLTYIIIGF
jgi:hypothetical protein